MAAPVSFRGNGTGGGSEALQGHHYLTAGCKCGTPAIDAGLISSAQAVDHYEMVRYGALLAWVRQLGKRDVVELLEENFEQESRADLKLSKLAEKSINRSAEAV